MVSAKSVKSIPMKLMSHADVVAGLVTFLGSFSGGLQEIGTHVTQIAANPRIPDPAYILSDVPNAIGKGILPVLLGVGLDMLDIESTKRFSTPLIKVGVGIMAGIIANTIFINCHNPSTHTLGTSSTSSYTSNVWVAPTAQATISTNALRTQPTVQENYGLPSR